MIRERRYRWVDQSSVTWSLKPFCRLIWKPVSLLSAPVFQVGQDTVSRCHIAGKNRTGVSSWYYFKYANQYLLLTISRSIVFYFIRTVQFLYSDLYFSPYLRWKKSSGKEFVRPSGNKSWRFQFSFLVKTRHQCCGKTRVDVEAQLKTNCSLSRRAVITQINN